MHPLRGRQRTNETSGRNRAQYAIIIAVSRLRPWNIRWCRVDACAAGNRAEARHLLAGERLINSSEFVVLVLADQFPAAGFRSQPQSGRCSRTKPGGSARGLGLAVSPSPPIPAADIQT